jgi:hypothetical protein
MVGDNWDWDVACAAEAGVPGYWIADSDQRPPSAGVSVVGQGTLDEFYDSARRGVLEDRFAQFVGEGVPR